mgnify:CR=1 FL=1
MSLKHREAVYSFSLSSSGIHKCFAEATLACTTIAVNLPSFNQHSDSVQRESDSWHTPSLILTSTTLKWERITISNAKRNLLGVYHKIKDLRLRGENIVFGYRGSNCIWMNSVTNSTVGTLAIRFAAG